jgi:hypothetical protein
MHSQPVVKWKREVSSKPGSHYIQGESLLHTLERRMGWRHSQSGCCGETRRSIPLGVEMLHNEVRGIVTIPEMKFAWMQVMSCGLLSIRIIK